jgi:peptidoglycan/xylan/chitin deacetylase (PgdA/CDA1 family)
VKILALKAISSSPGSNPAMAKPILRLIRQGYGPISSRNGVPPTMCVSVDFDVTIPSRYDDNRSGTRALVELARRYRIPITWAVCGMSAEKDTESYSAIEGSEGAEIGVHTYSHLDATAVSADEFRSDIVRCTQLLRLRAPRTFVFPWNREAHFEVVKGLGFKVFRGKERAIGNPVQRGGIWNIRPVYYVDQKSMGAENLMKKYLDVCITLSTPFHLWTHPWSLVTKGRAEPMMQTLEALFAYVAERRGSGELATSTLGEIAEALDSRHITGDLAAPTVASN